MDLNFNLNLDETSEWQKPIWKEWEVEKNNPIYKTASEKESRETIYNPINTALRSILFIIDTSNPPMLLGKGIKALEVSYRVFYRLSKDLLKSFPNCLISLSTLKPNSIDLEILMDTKISNIQELAKNRLRNLSLPSKSDEEVFPCKLPSILNFSLNFFEEHSNSPYTKEVIFLTSTTCFKDDFEMNHLIEKCKREFICFSTIHLIGNIRKLKKINETLKGNFFHSSEILKLILKEKILSNESEIKSMIKLECEKFKKILFPYKKTKERIWKRFAFAKLLSENVNLERNEENFCTCHFRTENEKLFQCLNCNSVLCYNKGICKFCDSLLLNFSDLKNWKNIAFEEKKFLLYDKKILEGKNDSQDFKDIICFGCNMKMNNVEIWKCESCEITLYCNSCKSFMMENKMDCRCSL